MLRVLGATGRHNKLPLTREQHTGLLRARGPQRVVAEPELSSRALDHTETELTSAHEQNSDGQDDGKTSCSEPACARRTKVRASVVVSSKWPCIERGWSKKQLGVKVGECLAHLRKPAVATHHNLPQQRVRRSHVASRSTSCAALLEAQLTPSSKLQNGLSSTPPVAPRMPDSTGVPLAALVAYQCEQYAHLPARAQRENDIR